jgi:hypothetical protein
MLPTFPSQQGLLECLSNLHNSDSSLKLERKLFVLDNGFILADKLGMRHEVQREYWQRFEDAFALEANEFVEAPSTSPRSR